MAAHLNLSIAETSVDIAANTSVISIVLSITTDGGTYNNSGDTSGSITIDGGDYSLDGKAVGQNTTTTLYSASHTITHNADGSRAVSVSAAFNVNTSYVGWVYASGSINLTTIPRATVPTADTTAIGNTMTIRLPRASAGFTHQVSYYFGSLSGTLAEAAGDQLQWTIPMDFCAQLPNATSGTVQISCNTYNGGTYVGNAVISVTLTVLPSVVPTVSAAVSPVNTNTWVAGKGIYAAGFSRARIDTTAAGVYGSTIKRIDITGDVPSYNAAASATSDILTAGTKTIIVTATDSRGRTASVTKTITVQPYAPPAIYNLSYKRGSYTGGVWADNDKGNDVKITFTLGLSLADYGNAANLSVAVDGETTQTTSGAAAGDKTYYFTTIGTDVSRSMTVTATDSTGTAGSKPGVIPTIKVGANYNTSIRSLRLGGVAEDADTFRCSLEAKFDAALQVGGVDLNGIRDFITETGVSGGWTYIKLKSGIKLCWKVFTFTTDVNYAFGGSYYSQNYFGSGAFPSGFFTQDPLQLPVLQEASATVISLQTGTAGDRYTTGSWSFSRPVPSTGVTGKVAVLAIGR